VDFQNFQRSNFDGDKYLKFLSFINLPCGHVMSHKKFGPIGSAVLMFIGYKQIDKQTNKHQDKPNLYIDEMSLINVFSFPVLGRSVQFYVNTIK